MASIRKLKNGHYKATVYLGRDTDGKQIRRNATRPTKREAKLAAREIEEESKDLSEVATMRLSTYMDRWLKLKKHHLAPYTIRSYKMYITVHFKPYFGRRRVNEITDLHIKEYVSLRLSEKMSGTTVRKHYFILQAMFRDALKHKSPFTDLKPPAMADFTPEIPSEEEFAVIAKHFKGIGKQWEAIILLAGWCGLRRGEIFALKWEDVTGDKIRVDESMGLDEEEYKWITTGPKSKKGKRTVTASDYLIELINSIKPDNAKATDYIINIKPDAFRSRFTRAKEKKLIPNYRFHDLRHYNASALYRAGIPDQYAAEMLGHDIAVLKAKYQHLKLKERVDLDDKIKGIFK